MYNPTHMISHELIISNSHVRDSSIPDKLKALRKVIKKYYRDRNMIIHEQQFLEDDIRELELYTILSNLEDPFEGQRDLLEEVKCITRQVVKNKIKEFSKVNHDSFVILGEIFNELKKEYEYKREILEAVHGKSELAEIPRVVIRKKGVR